MLLCKGKPLKKVLISAVDYNDILLPPEPKFIWTTVCRAFTEYPQSLDKSFSIGKVERDRISVINKRQ